MFAMQTVCNATRAAHALRLDQFKTLHGQRTHFARSILTYDIEAYFVSQQVGM
jgi:hypothetical protein